MSPSMMTFPSKKPTGVVVDGDILVYRCGFAAQKTVRVLTHDSLEFPEYFDSARDMKEFIGEQIELGNIASAEECKIDSFVEAEPAGHAIQALNSCLKDIERTTGLPIKGLYLSEGSDTFRHRAAVTRPYKGNRSAPRPVHYDDLRGFMINHRGARVFSEVEADDALASHARNNIVASIDKDLLQVPGVHYNFVEKQFYIIDVDNGHINLARQMLTGDSIDNIPGIKGMGEARANAFIEEKLSEGCDPVDLLRKVAEDIYHPRLGEGWWPYYKEQLTLLYLLRGQADSALGHLKRCWGDNDLLEGMEEL